jgi:hypothetical protein
MKIYTRRTAILLIAFLLCGGLAWHLFYTDKRSATVPIESPLRWLDDETLLSFEEGSLYLRKQGATRREIYTLAPPANMFSSASACISQNLWWLSTWQITATGSGMHGFSNGPVSLAVGADPGGWISVLETTQHGRFAKPVPISCMEDEKHQTDDDYLRSGRISVDGKSYFLGLPGAYDESRLHSELTSAPRGGRLYLNARPRGLVTIDGKKLSLHEFPDEYVETFGFSPSTQWGYALWDRSLERVLFVQSACLPVVDGESCTRKALWLTPELEPLSTVQIPGESLVEIKSGYNCFSCGCGCYSHQNIYVEGGNIYAHVWGYPVANNQRGIYQLVQAPSGPQWEKIVSGRPQPPLSFSPDGNKVAYFEISWFGDSFVIADITSQN